MSHPEKVIAQMQESIDKLKQDNHELFARLREATAKSNYQDVMIPDDEITDIAFNHGYGMDINTPKLQSAEHIAYCNGLRKGSEIMWLKLNK